MNIWNTKPQQIMEQLTDLRMYDVKRKQQNL